MNFDRQRHNMVVEQLERRDIYDPRVLEAMLPYFTDHYGGEAASGVTRP